MAPAATLPAMETLLLFAVTLFVGRASFAADWSGSQLTASSAYEANGEYLLFTEEPKELVEFSNSTGIKLSCRAKGKPDPKITWLTSGGVPVNDIPGLRYTSVNGDLEFPPFSAENYRQDVHSVSYNCLASNSLGSIISRDVRVKAVIFQHYEAYVYDIHVTRGNNAILQCHIPSFLKKFILPSSWIKDTIDINSRDVDDRNKYIVLSDGDLFIRDIQQNDHGSTFKCKTINRLTNMTKISSSSGKIFVTDPQTNISPRIHKMESEITTHEGNSLNIPCIAEGNPVPGIQWFKKSSGNQNLITSSVFLNFNFVRHSDGGTYECVANNTVGVQRQALKISVIVPLKVAVSPKTITADVGSTVEISCKTEGNPIDSVKWFRSGKPISSNNDLIAKNDKLIIKKLSSFMKGIYQCMAKSNGASAYDSSVLKLGDLPPEFISSFNDVILRPGEPLFLSCSATGSPLPSVSWFLYDTKISNTEWRVEENGQVTSWLNITSAKTTDGGVYTCKATNKAGYVKFSGKANVYGPLSARSKMQVSTIVGENAELFCPVNGYPITKIVWRKGSQILPIEHRQAQWENGTFIIRNVQKLLDSGIYECDATDIEYKSVTGLVELKVMVPPKITPFFFQDDLVKEGMRARIHCVVSEGDLPLNIYWTKDGEPIPPSFGVIVRDLDEYSSILTISSVSPRHNGDYTCTASNWAATTHSTATLSVNVPPQWITFPNDSVIATEGMPLFIHCQADGFPKPTITWKKALGRLFSNEQVMIRSNNHINVFPNGSLYFDTITEEDKGYYFCYASNGVGVDRSKSVLLQVQTPVYFKRNAETLRTKIGSAIELICEAFGERPINFIWRFNGKKIDTADKNRYKISTDHSGSNKMLQKLSIQKASREDHGLYTCYAANALGNASMEINLIIQELPSSPEITSLRNLQNRSVEIFWKRPFDGHSQLLKYSVQLKKKQDSWTSRSVMKTVEASSLSTIIKDLTPATHYEFRIAAENEIGIGPFGNVMSSVIDEEAPEGSPEQVEVETVNTQTLRVSWKPPKKSTWNGVIRGYRIGCRNHDSSEEFAFHTLEVPEDYTEDLIYQLTDLQMYTKYEIVVQAYNNGGRGPYSDKVIVMTSEDVPHHPPTNVRCSALSSHTIYVVWNPPPTDSVNGILLGYKVFYRSLSEWTDNGLKHNNTVTPKIMLTGLEVNANYSITVSAFTKLGDGVKSQPIFCKTYEDVPGAPAAIKALPVSENSVLVSWLPPAKSYGSISKYNVYYTTVGDKEEHKDYSKKTLEGVNVHTIESDSKTFEVKGLQSNIQYEFWVTALSSIGEGPISHVIRQQPNGGEVPAKIASFDEVIKTKWKRDVELPCRATGNPSPQRNWFQRGRKLTSDDRLLIRFDGALLIKTINREDSGNYTCEIANKLGHDEIHYSIMVLVPPDIPMLDVISKTFDSVRLEWQPPYDGGDPIQSYLLYYRKQNGRWETKDFQGNVFNYVLNNLSCGASYQMYMEAVNSVGTSKPSETITVNTFSENFQLPAKSALIQEGSMYVTVHLDAWPSTSCPVKYFVLEYRDLLATDWTLYSNNLKPTQKKLVISNLQPAMPYVLRLSAYTTDEDFNIGEYMFSTHSLSGGVHPSDVQHKEEKVVLFYMNPWIFIPIVVFIIVGIIVAVVIFVYCKRKTPVRQDPPIDWTPYLGNLSGTEEIYLSDADYGTYAKIGGRGTIPRQGTLYRKNLDENIYATIGPSDRYSRMTLTRNRHGTISRRGEQVYPQETIPRNSGNTNPFTVPETRISNNTGREGFYNEPTNSNISRSFSDATNETVLSARKNNENQFPENFGEHFNI